MHILCMVRKIDEVWHKIYKQAVRWQFWDKLLAFKVRLKCVRKTTTVHIYSIPTTPLGSLRRGGLAEHS